jgi:alkylation response protein AidB-like acyl-CoA dehydrogenase
VDFELGAEDRSALARVEAALEAEGDVAAAAPGLDPADLRGLVLRLQAAVGAGPALSARLALARAAPALLLAVDATRHLRDLVAAAGGAGLPPGEAEALARGERVGAVARADDAAAPAARLVREGGGYRLTARKGFVANAPLADWIGVLAEAEGGPALCLVRASDPGVRVGPRLALMGLDALAVAPVEADGAPLEAARVLGPGPAPLDALYEREANLSLALAAAGLARGALQAAHRHALAHRREGRPVFGRQEVAFPLAEVLASADAAELLARRAAWLVASGDPDGETVVRCAKVFCCERAERAASACLQVTAGEGYRRGTAAERAYRDAKGLALAGTTLEVARMAIADALLARGA